MTIHSLKCWPEPFEALLAGRKTFDIRQETDRRFEPEDVLVLREWDPPAKKFTGRVLVRGVSYLARAPAWGLPDGMVVMALARSSRGWVERLRSWWAGG